MCCLIDHIHGRLEIRPIKIEIKNGEHICYARAVYDRTLLTKTERISRIFQNLEFAENVAKIGDESFHLIGSFIQPYTTVMLYQTLRSLHHAAHDVEHVLDIFCCFNDIFLLFSGKFFVYHDKEQKQLDLGRSLGRLCLAVSHFLATATFLSVHKLYQFGRLEKYFKYSNAFSTVGYGIWTISIIWRRFHGKKNKHFYSDLGIYFGGCLYESFPIVKNFASFAPHINLINKITAIVGIIHAGCFVNRLRPKNKEVFHVQFKLPTIVSGQTPTMVAC